MNGDRGVLRGILKNCMALAAVLVFMAPFVAFGSTCTNNNCKSECDDGNTIFGPEGEGSGAPKTQIDGYIWKCSYGCSGALFWKKCDGSWRQELGICPGNAATSLEPGLTWSKQDGGSRSRCWRSTAPAQPQQKQSVASAPVKDFAAEEEERKRAQLESDKAACSGQINSVWSGTQCVPCGDGTKPNSEKTTCVKINSCKYITGGNLEKCASESAYQSPAFNNCVEENKVSVADCD